MKGDSTLTIKYAFTREGISAFLDSALGDIFHALESNTEDVPSIVITVGDRELVIPTFAEQYEELSEYLTRAIETEEENNA